MLCAVLTARSATHTTPQIRVANNNNNNIMCVRAPPSHNDSYMHSLNARDNLWPCFAFNVRLFPLSSQRGVRSRVWTAEKIKFRIWALFSVCVNIFWIFSFKFTEPSKLICFPLLTALNLASLLCMFNFINIRSRSAINIPNNIRTHNFHNNSTKIEYVNAIIFYAIILERFIVVIYTCT